MNFENKVVVITGGAHGIGLCTAEEFKRAGAHVYIIDAAQGEHYVGDIADKATLESFAQMVIREHGRVDPVAIRSHPGSCPAADNTPEGGHR